MRKQRGEKGKVGRKPVTFVPITICVKAEKSVIAVVDRMRGKRSRSAVVREVLAEWARVRRRNPGQDSSDTPDMPMDSVETEPAQAAKPAPFLPSNHKESRDVSETVC